MQIRGRLLWNTVYLEQATCQVLDDYVLFFGRAADGIVVMFLGPEVGFGD
ncbi:hypothetical protein MAMT_02174 [Methylacidimicrobium tartarophylax]|uniref:Uncharacterized protein n=1 Tax=Methylacidimicrobium tartarophylax TaxID=1041768 RepID=A0A5E6MIL8_9BACT|nr:hypothetical protein MAMT_02174 [Methylacidimicrobium tartarophylax]